MTLHIHDNRSAYMPSPRCESCAFLPDCKGREADSLFNCFDMFCCGRDKCDQVCPNNPDFEERLLEIRGFSRRDLKPIVQSRLTLPLYIPHATHQYCRKSELNSQWVSLSPYQFIREDRQGRAFLSVKTPEALRATFRLKPNSLVIMRGIDEDAPLERYWAFRRRDGLPSQFRELGVSLFLGPNYSHFSDVPRTQILFNRKRQLLCLSEMAEAGLNFAPHLNTVTDGDWVFWADYLRDNPHITMVAKEFQTGHRTRSEAQHAVDCLEEIQNRIGRELHLIAVGAAQFAELFADRLRHFSILDSRPFMNAMHRYRFIPKGRRGRYELEMYLPGFGVDDLVNSNIAAYARWLEHRKKLATGRDMLRRQAS